MPAEAEVPSHSDQKAIGIFTFCIIHQIKASAKIQIIETCSSHKRLSEKIIAQKVAIASMIINHTSPSVFICINSDSPMSNISRVNSNPRNVSYHKRDTATHRSLDIRIKLITCIHKSTSIETRTDEKSLTTWRIILCQRRNSHHGYCQN